MPTLNLGCDDDPRLAPDAPFVSLAQQAQIYVPSIKPDGPQPPAMKRSPYEALPQQPNGGGERHIDVNHDDSSVAEKKVLKKVSIGTDSGPLDVFRDHTDISHVGTGQRTHAKMDLAEVAGKMLKLRRLIENDGEAIGVLDFELVGEISELCDQIFYWGVAEARFPENPLSVLCECEAVPTLMPLMSHDRSALMIASLTALGALVQHPRSASIFCALPGAFDKLFESFTKYPNKEEVLIEALVVSRYAASLGGTIDLFLSSPVVSAIIKTMQAFPNHLEIQKRCAMFFADVVSVPRVALTSRGDPVAPNGILFAQIGCVTEHVLLCFRQQPTSSTVADAVAHYCKVVSAFPMNLKKLLSEKDYLPVCQEIAANNLNTPKVIVNALLALAAAIPALKPSGKRFFAVFLRNILIKSREVSVIRCVIGLQHALLRSCDQGEPLKQRGGDEKSVSFNVGSHESPDTLSDYEAMKMFFVENQIPQVIGLAIDHFGVASFADEEGAEETEEYKAAEALSRTGVSALKEMSASRFHWL